MLRKFTLYATCLVVFPLLFSSCDDDNDPEAENEVEQITKITLTFNDGTNDIVGTYLDSDGDGPASGVFSPTTIELDASTAYSLSIEFTNTLEDPEEDITEEVEEEGDEHQIFFSYTNSIFTDAADAWYNDTDNNSLPIGLSTNWNTGNAGASGNFTVTLKHQPDIKSATSTINDGETDIAQTFSIEIK